MNKIQRAFIAGRRLIQSAIRVDHRHTDKHISPKIVVRVRKIKDDDIGGIILVKETFIHPLDKPAAAEGDLNAPRIPARIPP